MVQKKQGKKKGKRNHADDEIPLLPDTNQIKEIRLKWLHNGQSRPDFAIEPSQGQESVWDFPRPPIIQPVRSELKVMRGEVLLAKTSRGVRVIETAGAPTYYFPPEDVKTAKFALGEQGSLCEWKGYSQPLLINEDEVGWRYVRMFQAFSTLYLWPAFYPSMVDCFIDDKKVDAQPGGYYGGWVTDTLTGPIKGSPGSQGW